MIVLCCCKESEEATTEVGIHLVHGNKRCLLLFPFECFLCLSDIDDKFRVFLSFISDGFRFIFYGLSAELRSGGAEKGGGAEKTPVAACTVRVKCLTMHTDTER